MIHRFKSKFFLGALGLSVTLNAVTLDDLRLMNRSLISRVVAFRASVSRVADFLLSESVISSVGLISCVGIGLGGATMFPPTLMCGVGCGLGIFNLWGRSTLRSLLKTVNAMDHTVKKHHQEFSEYRQEARANHQETSQNIAHVEDAVNKHHKESVIAQTVLHNKIECNEDNARNRHSDIQGRVDYVTNQVKEADKNALIRDQKTQEELRKLERKITTETAQLSATIKSNYQEQKKDNVELRAVIATNNQQFHARMGAMEHKAEERDKNTREKLQTLKDTVQGVNTNLETAANQLLERQQILRDEYAATKQQLKEMLGVQEEQGAGIKYLVQAEKQRAQDATARGVLVGLVGGRLAAQQKQNARDDQMASGPDDDLD